jgi:hypothetical protein
MMDSVGIRDRDTRKGAVSPVQNETICGQPHPTVPSTPPPAPLKLPAGPKMRTAAGRILALPPLGAISADILPAAKRWRSLDAGGYADIAEPLETCLQSDASGGDAFQHAIRARFDDPFEIPGAARRRHPCFSGSRRSTMGWTR